MLIIAMIVALVCVAQGNFGGALVALVWGVVLDAILWVLCKFLGVGDV